MKTKLTPKFHCRVRAVLYALALIGAVFHSSLIAEKVLSYDEEKGIIFVDKEDESAGAKKPLAPVQKPLPLRPQKDGVSRRLDGKTVDAGIQRGRQKDPPEVYFQSGLQYFKNKNFDDALKNFTRADSLDPQPKYSLWMGKTLRQLNKNDKLLAIMNQIVKLYPESEVADDALFEIAFYHQANSNYEMAMKAYTQLSEQYPFGTSFSNGENFREIAHKQCLAMHAEIITTLNVLGFKGEELESLIADFQKSKGLTPNGIGNAVTITAMKTAYEEFLKMDAAHAIRKERMGNYRVAANIAFGILLLNFIFLLICNRKIAGQKKQLETLKQSLNELSMDIP